MKKIWKTLSILGTATVCTAGISTVAVSVSNTNNSHTSSINTLTPTDRIINIQAMSAPTGGNQISSLNFGQTAYLVAQCSDDSAILGNFTWVIESGDSNATPTYVETLTILPLDGSSTCTAVLAYTKAGIPANGNPIDIVVACTLNGATKRVQVTINPVAITTQLEFTSSNILDLDDADSTVTAKLTCPAAITGVTPDVNWKMDDKANPPLSIAQVGTSWGADGTAQFTIKKGSQVDTGHFAITCTLTIGGVADTSTPADLNIVNDYTFTPVPVTPTYFALNDAGDTVSGFSSAVKANYAVGGAKNMLAKFDTIDFQHSPVKYMAAAASFGKADADTPGNVFDAWDIRQLNLSGIKFHFGVIKNTQGDDIVQSGYQTFQYCNFKSLKWLNLFATDFASCISTDVPDNTLYVYTASYTFDHADLSGLDTLSLSGAVFAAANMTTLGAIHSAYYIFGNADLSGLSTLNISSAIFAVANMTDTGGAITCYSTFARADLSGLSDLNLSGVIFAVANMTSGLVETASNTFAGADLSGLGTDPSGLGALSLSGAVFAVANMTVGDNYIRTAVRTFDHTDLSGLSDLNLSGSVFAVANMTAAGVVYTAYCTFSGADLSGLGTDPSGLGALSLSGAVFAAANMNTTSAVYTAYLTFSGANLSGLSTLSLSGVIFAMANMTSGVVYTAYATFGNTKTDGSGDAVNLSGLSTLDLSMATFAVANMTSGAVYTACYTFGVVNTAANKSADLSKLTTLILGNIQRGNDKTGINTINANCFTLIKENTLWSTVPLQITGTWAQTNWQTQFNTWFGDDAWTYNA